MNRISLKKLNEGLQAEFSTIANDEKNRLKSQEISSGSENNEVINYSSPTPSSTIGALGTI